MAKATKHINTSAHSKEKRLLSIAGQNGNQGEHDTCGFKPVPFQNGALSHRLELLGRRKCFSCYKKLPAVLGGMGCQGKQQLLETHVGDFKLNIWVPT